MFKRVYLVTYIYKCNGGEWGFGSEKFKWYKNINECAFAYFISQIIYRNNRVLIDNKTHYKEVMIMNIIKL